MTLEQYINEMRELLRKETQLYPYLGEETLKNDLKCRDVGKLLLSMYVYLKDRDGVCGIESFKKYAQDEMLTYWFHSMSPDYQKIMCTKTKLEIGKGRALTLCKDIYYRPEEGLDFAMLMRGIVDQNINSLFWLMERYENGNTEIL